MRSGVKKFDYCASCTFYLGAIVVTLVCQALVSFVAVALSSSYPDISTNGDFLTAFMMFIQAANAAFILLFCKVNKTRFDCSLAKNSDKKLDCRDFILPIAAAIVLLFTMYLPTMWYGFFTQYVLHISPSVGSIDLTTSSSVVMIVIASVFMAPVFEESIYRGVLFNGLKKNYAPIKAAVLCALAFMLMHMSPIQVVFQFSLGALAALIMSKTNRLLPCVLLHATANAAALAIQFDPLVGVVNGCINWLVKSPVAALFITLALLVGGGALLFVILRFGYGKTVQTEAIGGESENLTPEKIAAADARKKDGKTRFFIAIAISGVMFVINLITMIVG